MLSTPVLQWTVGHREPQPRHMQHGKCLHFFLLQGLADDLNSKIQEILIFWTDLILDKNLPGCLLRKKSKKPSGELTFGHGKIHQF